MGDRLCNFLTQCARVYAIYWKTVTSVSSVSIILWLPKRNQKENTMLNRSPDEHADGLAFLFAQFANRPFNAHTIANRIKMEKPFRTALFFLNPPSVQHILNKPNPGFSRLPTSSTINNWFKTIAGTPYGGLLLTRDRLGNCTIALAESRKI